MKRKMLRSINVQSVMTQRMEELEAAKQAILSEREKAPKGRLHIVSSKGRVQYYQRDHSDDRSGVYIQKRDISTLHPLVQKLYGERALKAIAKELACLEKSLRAYKISPTAIKDVYDSFPEESRQYINPVDMPDDEYACLWQAQDYQHKAISEDVPMYITARGEKVRSKSEVLIADALAKRKIPYRYECALKLKNGDLIHPDFTILDVKRRKVMYWEHRGMMDTRDYAQHAVQRIKDYAQSGIILGRDLIITEETSTTPLGTNEIKQILDALTSVEERQ